jgi:hypothetical protein
MNGLVAQYMASRSGAPNIRPEIQGASQAAFTKQLPTPQRPTVLQPTRVGINKIDPYSDIRARERFQEGMTKMVTEQDRQDDRALFNANELRSRSEFEANEARARQVDQQKYTSKEKETQREYDLASDIEKHKADLNRTLQQHLLGVERDEIASSNDFINTLIEHDLTLERLEIQRKNDRKNRKLEKKDAIALQNRGDKLARKRQEDLTKEETRKRLERGEALSSIVGPHVFAYNDYLTKGGATQAIANAKAQFARSISTDNRILGNLGISYNPSTDTYADGNGAPLTFAYVISELEKEANVGRSLYREFALSPPYQKVKLEENKLAANYRSAVDLLKVSNAPLVLSQNSGTYNVPQNSSIWNYKKP